MRIRNKISRNLVENAISGGRSTTVVSPLFQPYAGATEAMSRYTLCCPRRYALATRGYAGVLCYALPVRAGSHAIPLCYYRCAGTLCYTQCHTLCYTASYTAVLAGQCAMCYTMPFIIAPYGTYAIQLCPVLYQAVLIQRGCVIRDRHIIVPTLPGEDNTGEQARLRQIKRLPGETQASIGACGQATQFISGARAGGAYAISIPGCAISLALCAMLCAIMLYRCALCVLMPLISYVSYAIR
jgi:hypothetical protein